MQCRPHAAEAGPAILGGHAPTGRARFEIAVDQLIARCNADLAGHRSRDGTAAEIRRGQGAKTRAPRALLGRTGAPISDTITVETHEGCNQNVVIVNFVQNHAY